jgi:Ser/Thr protein kinase RdoA (MazF antagonist)
MPTWRSGEDVGWVHEVIRSVATTVPEAVAPLPGADGRSVLVVDEHPLAVFPFVGGDPLDVGDRDMRVQAAGLLARLHRAMLHSPPTRPRPGPIGPPITPIDEPPEINDPELASWRRSLHERGCLRGPIHGDVYPLNIRCRAGRIVGLIDWMEAHVDFVGQELGWTTWELAQTDSGDDLSWDRAADFVRQYRAAGGPVPGSEDRDLVQFIRWRLRNEIRAELARGAASEPSEYTRAELRAFARLGGTTLSSAG